SGQISDLVEEADGTFTQEKLLKTTLHITTFGEDGNGELYLADEGGAIYAITETHGISPRRRVAAH
ncbi:MAG: hypothetical protein ABI837_12135, partial [Acidobacteriota bacterium]